MGSRPPKPTDKPAQPRFKAKAEVKGFSFSPPALASVKKLPEWPTFEERIAGSEKISEEINSGTDRAAAILGALYVQDALNASIISHFDKSDDATIKELCRRDGPLYSFGTATILAHAMNIIDDTSKKHLDIIRGVRNAFAHAFRPITFNTTSIADSCLGITPRWLPHLKFMKKVGDHMSVEQKSRYLFLQGVFTESGLLFRHASKMHNAKMLTIKRKIRKADQKLSGLGST